MKNGHIQCKNAKLYGDYEKVWFWGFFLTYYFEFLEKPSFFDYIRNIHILPQNSQNWPIFKNPQERPKIRKIGNIQCKRRKIIWRLRKTKLIRGSPPKIVKKSSISTYLFILVIFGSKRHFLANFGRSRRNPRNFEIGLVPECRMSPMVPRNRKNRYLDDLERFMA